MTPRNAQVRAEPARQAIRAPLTASGAIFVALCRLEGLPAPAAEFRFDATRRWRFDWAWPEQRIAVEVDGGIFSGGAHVRGARILKTHEKLNAAASQGWRLLYRIPKNLATTETIALLKAML